MVIAKGLIFKSLLGIATSGVVIVPIVFKKEISSWLNKKPGENSVDNTNKGSNQGVNDVSSSQTTVNTGDQQISSSGSDVSTSTPVKPEEVDTLGIPQSCKTSCQLTADQLKNLKFEPKTAGASLTVEGLTDNNNTVTLEVEDKKNDLTNYPKGKKYTLKVTGDKVTIGGLKDGDIAIEKNKDVVVREKQSGGQLETVEDALGIPKSCKADQAKNNSPQTCQLTQEQLGKIKFEPKSSGGSISVSGLSNNDKVTLTISDESSSSEKANYPKGKKYNFKTSDKKTAKITGAKEDISITSAGINFREKTAGGQLEKVPVVKPQNPTTDSLGLPTSCKSSQVTENAQKQECQLTVDDLKKVKFKDLGDSGTATVTNLTDKIKLTISWDDDKSDYPDNKKYSFDNSSNNSEIKITKEKQEVTIAKLTESWFKNESGKLTLVKTKLKEEKENKMKDVKDELTKLGLSTLIKLEIEDFKKDDRVDFEQKKLKLDKNTMKLIQFSEFSGPPTDISDWNDGNKFDLMLDYAEDSNSYPKNMKFSFKNNSGKDITIKSAGKSLKFSNDKWETFKVVNNELEKTTTG